MKNMKTTILSAALTGCMLLAGTAQASYGDVNAKLDSLGPTGTTFEGVGGGVFNFTRQAGGSFSGTLLPGTAGAFVAFCLDINQGISVPSGTINFEVDDLSVAPVGGSNVAMGAKAGDIAKLIGSALGGVLSAASSLTDLEAAGLQLAIWEIVNDNTYDITGGNFVGNTPGWTGSAAAKGQATTYLNGLANYTGPAAANLFALTSNSVQDFLVQTTAVPIPAAAWLLGSGLLGLFGLARRKTAVATA